MKSLKDRKYLDLMIVPKIDILLAETDKIHNRTADVHSIETDSGSPMFLFIPNIEKYVGA